MTLGNPTLTSELKERLRSGLLSAPARMLQAAALFLFGLLLRPGRARRGRIISWAVPRRFRLAVPAAAARRRCGASLAGPRFRRESLDDAIVQESPLPTVGMLAEAKNRRFRLVNAACYLPFVRSDARRPNKSSSPKGAQHSNFPHILRESGSKCS